MEIPFVNTVATGQNIDRLRIEAGLSIRGRGFDSRWSCFIENVV